MKLFNIVVRQFALSRLSHHVVFYPSQNVIYADGDPAGLRT